MAENQQAEIEILVGALGGYKIDGESGALIKQQLQAQLVKGVDIKIGIDQESKKAFRSFLKENVKVKLGLSQDAAKDLNQFLKKDYKLKVHIDDASKAELKKYIDKIMEAQGTAVKKATQQSSSKNPVMSNTSWQTTLRGYDAAIERANKLKLTNDDVVSAVEAFGKRWRRSNKSKARNRNMRPNRAMMKHWRRWISSLTNIEKWRPSLLNRNVSRHRQL